MSPPDLQALVEKAKQLVTSGINDLNSLGRNAEVAIRDKGNQIQGVVDDAVNDISERVTKARDELLDILRLLGEQVTSLLGELPDPFMGSVNGVKFLTPVDGYVLGIKAIYDGDSRIKIETHEPAVIRAFGPLIASGAEDFQRKMVDRFWKQFGVPDPQISRVAGADDAMVLGAIFAGVASCITAASAGAIGMTIAPAIAIFIILLGVAIIYAIHEGYDVENIEVGVGEMGRPTIKFSLKKH